MLNNVAATRFVHLELYVSTAKHDALCNSAMLIASATQLEQLTLHVLSNTTCDGMATRPGSRPDSIASC